MLDARITVINGAMREFDRKTKSVTVLDHQGKTLTLNYDLLVVGVGLIDNTIKELTRDKAARAEQTQVKDPKTIETGRPS